MKSAAKVAGERQAFYAELKTLKDYFEAMAPELEVTVREIAANVHKLFEIAERYDAEPQDAGMYMALAKIRGTSVPD